MRARLSSRFTIAAGLMLLLLLGSDAFAQRGQTASLAGTVKDTSGAVLAGVTLTASSPQLIGGPQTTETDAEGRYRFSSLLPGTYEVAAARQGFKTLKHTSIELPPGLGLIVDFKLELAPVAEVVNVEAVVPAVDVHSSASPVVIDQELVHNLPLDRSVVTYVNLAPGVTNNVAFGGMFRGNPVSLDGTSGNDPEYGAPFAAPNANWIDQIQIVSLGANAQYGDYTGSRFNAITRSGSNRFSGLAEYWTTRPNWTGSNRGSLPPDLARRFRPIEVLERWDTSEQVGGPIVRGRLWFFSGLEYYRNSQRPFRFADVLRLPTEPAALTREPKSLVKLTGTPAPRVRVEGYIEYENSKTTNAGAGPLVRPEALGIGANPTHMGNARLTWTLNDRTLLEARYGSFRSHFTNDPTPPNTRSGPSGHRDRFTGISSVNIDRYGDFVRRTSSASATLTHYADRLAGKSHELKGGIEHERGSFIDTRGYPGGALYFDYNGAPLQVYFWDGSIVRPSHWTTSLFAQDTWEVNDRLTIEPGVRAGFYDSSLPVQGFTLYKTSSISPRLGAAWDLAADHRTVIRAHYGWYHDPMVTDYYFYLDSNGCSAPRITAKVLGPGQFQEVRRSGGAVEGLRTSQS